MAVARFANSKPLADTDTLLYTVERTALTSLVAVNVSGFTNISAWIVPAGEDENPENWIYYVDNVGLTNRNSFETFRIAVNVGDGIYVKSTSGEVTFFINGVYDIAGRANVTTGAQEPESPQIGDIWIKDDESPTVVYYWDGAAWLFLHDGILDTTGTSLSLALNATTVSIGGDTGTTTINNNLVVDGTIDGTYEGEVIASEYGGTGFGSYTTGDLLYASATDTLSKLPIGTEAQVLTVSEAGVAWVDIDALPDQAGNSGKYLTTDGTDASWQVVDLLPSQTDNAGKYLTTNGEVTAWARISGGSAQSEMPENPTEGQVWLDTDGTILPTSVELRRWTKTLTTSTAVFTGAGDETETLAYSPSTEQVYLNGVALIRGTDYVAASGTTITLSSPAAIGDILQVVTLPPVEVANVINNSLFDAKGDIIAATADNSPTVVPVGADGFVLSADSTAPAGVSWKRASATDDVLMLMGV